MQPLTIYRVDRLDFSRSRDFSPPTTFTGNVRGFRFLITWRQQPHLSTKLSSAMSLVSSFAVLSPSTVARRVPMPVARQVSGRGMRWAQGCVYPGPGRASICVRWVSLIFASHRESSFSHARRT